MQDDGLSVWIYASQEIEWTAESEIEKLDKKMLTGEWKLLGAAVMEEEVKEGSKECLQELDKAGVKFWMVTSSDEQRAREIGL